MSSNNASQKIRQGFDEHLSILVDELRLAIKWERPSIVLVVNSSGISQKRAEAALTKEIAGLNQRIIHFRIGAEQPNVIALMMQSPDRNNAVFFVSNIGQGGGEDSTDTYRALNLYREKLIENKIRVVFWLTEDEARLLPKLAPDFWSFRHRVLEFSRQRGPKGRLLLSGVLLWSRNVSLIKPKLVYNQISLDRGLLASLPEENESITARLELMYELGQLYWLTYDLDIAFEILTSGLHLAEHSNFTEIRNDFLKGLAIIDYETGDNKRAISIMQKLVGVQIADPVALMNLAIYSQAAGRNQQGITLAKRAVRLDPENPRLRRALGYLYVVMQKFDEAISSIEYTRRLDPGSIDLDFDLAAFYQKAGYIEKLGQLLGEMQYSITQSDKYYIACSNLILGNTEEAIDQFRLSMSNDSRLQGEIRRSPIINLLLQEQQIAALMRN